MIKPKQIVQTLTNLFARVRLYLVFVALVALGAYLLWQVQKIFSPPVNKQRLEERELELEAGRVHLDEETLAEVLRRSREGQSTTPPDSTGDSNPFN